MRETTIPVEAAPPGCEYRHITVIPLGGAGGAVVGGSISPATSTTTSSPRSAARSSIISWSFRGQSLDPDRQVAFSRRFGPPSPVPFVEPIAGHPEVIAVIREAHETQPYTFGSLWHSDFSFLPEPPSASILHAIEVPPWGGDTIWANQYLAYRCFSRGMRTMLAGLDGEHSAVNAYSPKMQAIHDTFAGMTVHTSEEATRVQWHPVVREHAETHRPALYVNQQYTTGLRGFAAHEAKPILDLLFAQGTRADVTIRWRWEAGDVAMWDNRCLQHMALAHFTGHRRCMHRTTVAGEAPVRATVQTDS